MLYKNLSLIPLVILLVACNGTMPIKERIENNLSCRTLPSSEAPNWVFGSGVAASGYYYGVGVANGFDVPFNEMKQRSRSFAEAEISSSIETRITSDLRQSVSMSASNGSSDLNKTVQQVIKSNSDLLLSDVQLDGSWFNQETCQLWTRVKLSRNSLKQSKKQMKIMVMLKLEESSKNIDSIKATIESDPNVILRKYGLKINAGDYLKALSLDVPDKESYSVLDLYAEYSITPEISATSVGVYDVEPYASAFQNTYTETYRPYASLRVLDLLVSTRTIDEKVLKRALTISIKNSIQSKGTRIIDYGARQLWYENWKDEYDKETDRLSALHKVREEKLESDYNSGRNSQKYEENRKELRAKISRDWELHRKLHDEFYGNQSSNGMAVNNFFDYIFTVHFAACYGNVKNLKILDEFDFSMNKKTKNGFSPLEVAEICKNKETIMYLR